MRNLKGMEQFFDEEYARRTDHRFHALGTPMDDGWMQIEKQFTKEKSQIGGRQPWWTLTDMAWVVCLQRGDAVDNATARRLLTTLQQLLDEDAGTSGENRLAPLLGDDMDTASIVNYGRTLQEPMSRMKLRAKMLQIFDDIIALMQTVHDVAADNTDAIMPGYTHLNQAQPVTLGHVLLSAFDGLQRGLQLFELAYKHTNRNTGGCGSCSGTSWPVDRWLLTDLLAFDDLVEPAYDAESAQDHSLTALYALTNICILLSQVAMNMNIWGMDEIDMIRVNPAWAGVSSFMPQKCDTGSNFERTRVKASDVIGEMFKCVTQLKGEPHADMQPQFQLPQRALLGMVHARKCLGWMNAMLNNIIPQKDRMLDTVRAGFSCASEVAKHLVTEHGYGNRMAHSIVATLVRQARTEGLKSYQCTGDMLDEAAEYLDQKPPGVDTQTLRKLLDPEHFVNQHTYVGGTAPQETQRLLKKRKADIADARSRHNDRMQRIAEGEQLLEDAIADICGGAPPDLSYLNTA